ncbi:hypothetical protein HOY82DRAFT_620300 [Tuber indicum]|nr:hypothetical protein HOY82DRAFT_620300 [Tuber indicum]
MSDFYTINSLLRGQDAPQPPSSAWGYEDPQAASNNPYTYHLQGQAPLEDQDTLAGLDPSGQSGAVPSQWRLNGSTVDSYSGSDTDYSRRNTMYLGNVDPMLTQSGSQFSTCFPHMPQVASAGQLTTAASSPGLPNYGSDFPGVRYTVDQGGGYFAHKPSHSVEQEQYQPASSPQGQKSYISPNVSNFEPSPLSPSQPTAAPHEGKQDTVVADNYPGLDPQRCKTCRKGCGRPADLVRHLKTSKSHHPPSGPACPETDCKFLNRFTREDNFKHHYKKQHRKSGEEADEIIAHWKAVEDITSSVGEGGNVSGRRRESTAAKGSGPW